MTATGVEDAVDPVDRPTRGLNISLHADSGVGAVDEDDAEDDAE